MPYSSVEQVEREIRCIHQSLEPDHEIIREKINEADDLINGYLGKVYIIPFRCCKENKVVNVVPHLVNQLSKKLAASFYIEWVFGVKAQTSAGLSTAERIYDRTISTLKAMIARKDAAPLLFCDYRPDVGLNEDGGFSIDIGGEDDPTDQFSSLGWSNTETYVPTFDEDDFRRQRVDPNKILDTRERKDDAYEDYENRVYRD